MPEQCACAGPPRPVWLYFVREYPRHTLVMFLFLTLAGVVESVGAVSVLPLLGALFSRDPAASPFLGRVTRLFAAAGVAPTLGNILLVICAALAGKALLTLLAYRETGYVEAEVTTRLRSGLLDRLLRADWPYFVAQKTGRLSFALSTEATQSGAALRCICQTFSYVIQGVSYLAAGLYISWPVMLAGLAAVGAFFALFRGLIGYVRRAGARQVAALNSMSTFFTDALIGAKPLKVMAAEERFLGCIRTFAGRFELAARQRVLGMGVLATIQEPLLFILLAAGLYWSTQRLGMDTAMLLTLAFFFYRLVSRLSTAQQMYQHYSFLEGHLVSLLGKIAEAEAHGPGGGGRPASGGRRLRLRRGVELRGVDFAYGTRPVLRGFGMTIPFGAVTALTGPSGAGKTTVTDLVTGLARPDAGRILVDGVPLEELDLRTWREQIGYVPQEVFLFNDTVRSNVLIGRDLPDAAVWRALELAGARGFVEAGGRGLDALVGEQGRTLSGGQRQRLMLARALAGNPSLLILDEATTGLDPVATRIVCDSLRGLQDGMAVLVVTHQEQVLGLARKVYTLAAAPVDSPHSAG